MRLFRSKGLYRFAVAAQFMLLLSVTVSLAFAGSSVAAEFPPMRVETVSGISMDLPLDFAVGPSVIVLVYDQNQQPQADSWVAFLDDMSVANPEARYYLMPALPAGLSMVRGMIEGAIQGTAADPRQLDRTIVVFTDVEALQQSLGVSGTAALHVLVLDDIGHVVATVSGAYSTANAAMIEDAMVAAALEGTEIGRLPGGK